MAKTKKKKSISERFWSKVDKTSGFGPDGDCWCWTDKPDRKGYGRLGYGDVNSGTRMIFAHRVSYWLHHPEWDIFDSEVCVCHHCDNPACINPKHFFLGSKEDNLRDRDQKGRVQHGTTHYRTSLNPDKIRAIRIDTRKHHEIAEDYEVSRAAISQIKRRANWAHVED